VAVLNAFYPSKDTIKYMIGGTAVMAAGELEGIERLPQSMVDLANAFLEETNNDPSLASSEGSTSE
jgi:hypothetical protein